MSELGSLRAIAHPVRLRMLSVLTGTAMSAADLARTLDISHANASYHLRQLADAGEVVEAGEQKIRGGTAKLYRYPHETELEAKATGRDATNEDRLLYTRARSPPSSSAASSTAVPGQGGLLSDLEGWVEPEVWDRATALLREASDAPPRLQPAARTPPTPCTSASPPGRSRMAGGEA